MVLAETVPLEAEDQGKSKDQDYKESDIGEQGTTLYFELVRCKTGVCTFVVITVSLLV